MSQITNELRKKVQDFIFTYGPRDKSGNEYSDMIENFMLEINRVIDKRVNEKLKRAGIRPEYYDKVVRDVNRKAKKDAANAK